MLVNIGDREPFLVGFLGVKTDGNTLDIAHIVDGALFFKISQLNSSFARVQLYGLNGGWKFLDNGQPLLKINFVSLVNAFLKITAAQAAAVPVSHIMA